jgi:transcriptional regulator with XRE-family HTH domain
MSEIGSALREARMRAGLDISAIEERTKIRAKYLRALENEEWAVLPGGTFTKGFLRSYADVLGLDGRALVEEYKQEFEQPSEPEVPLHPGNGAAASGRRVRERDPAVPGPGPSRVLVAIVVVVCVIVGLWLIGVVNAGNGKAKPHGRGGGRTAASVHGESGATGRTLPNPCRAGAASALRCVRLQLEPTAVVYVCLIGDDGLVRIPGEMLDAASAQARITYHALNFTLTLGAPRAHVLLNGTPLALGGGSGAVRFAISDAGAKALAVPKQLRCT